MEIPTVSDYALCPFRRYRQAEKATYGANIPGYAQGAVFPGDGAGYECAVNGRACYDPACYECPRFRLIACPLCNGRAWIDTDLNKAYCEDECDGATST